MAVLSSEYYVAPDITVTHTKWWIKDPVDPSLNLEVDVESPAFVISKPQDSALYSPLGRPYKVKVAEIFKGDEFTLDFVFTDEAFYVNFIDLMETMRSLYITDWSDHTWYVTHTGILRSSRENYGSYWNKVTIGFVEVEPLEV